MHDQTVNAASIDPREVEYYSALANTWWDRNGPFWPLHRLNELRVGWIRDRLCTHFGRNANSSAPLAGLRILDVGCGGGLLSESMARLGAQVEGIDVVEKNIQVARLHAQRLALDIGYSLRTAESLAAMGRQFDAVLNMEVVEYVADLPGFLNACSRLVRPGGMMVVSTINRTPLAWLFAIVGAEYVLGWLPKGTHRWRMFRRPAEIDALLHRNGLAVEAMTGVRVNPFTRTFSLQRGVAVNYMLYAVLSGALDETLEAPRTGD